jgi:hypothetical protein
MQRRCLAPSGTRGSIRAEGWLMARSVECAGSSRAGACGARMVTQGGMQDTLYGVLLTQSVGWTVGSR